MGMERRRRRLTDKETEGKEGTFGMRKSGLFRSEWSDVHPV